MISEGDCWRRADANWALAQRLSSEGDYGWATTLAFYAAVHMVNVLMVHAGRYSDDMDHNRRELWLRTNHPAIEVRYSSMLAKSKRARYEVSFDPDESYYQVQVKHLDSVRGYVHRFLAGQIPGLSP